MRPVTRTMFLVVALAVTGAAVGCSSADDPGAGPSASGASGTPSPSTPPPAPSSTTSPSATPSLDPHPPVDALVLSTAGLGPLTIGIPPETNPGAADGLVVENSADGLQPPTSESRVVIIHVQGPGTDPDWTSAGTDLVAGGCL